jgi:hypothetical protein
MNHRTIERKGASAVRNIMGRNLVTLPAPIVIVVATPMMNDDPGDEKKSEGAKTEKNQVARVTSDEDYLVTRLAIPLWIESILLAPKDRYLLTDHP